MKTLLPLAAVAALLYHAPAVLAACGSAGCAVNTNWETQGPHLGAGLRIDLRFEQADQDVLRTGSRRAAHPAAGSDEEEEHHEEDDDHHEPAHAAGARAHALHDGEQHGHDERATRNRAVRLHLDYSFDANWGLSFELPIISRQHHHIELEDGANENWDFDKLGDARLTGRYAFTGDANATWGLSFGAKLPSGDFKQRNREGEVAERSLQPGSGSTDAILGAFYQRSREASAWSWFGQLSLQQALNDRDNFKPGRQVAADIGLSYRFNSVLSALLQLNLQHRARDRGANAEPNDSGGKSVFFSPGLQARLGENTLAYAFVQLPLYQYVNGTQLTLDKALLFGLSHHF